MDTPHPDLPYGAKIIDGTLMVPSPPLSPGVVIVGSNDSGSIWTDGARREWIPFQKPVEPTVDVYDANNYVRKVYEKASSNPLRQLWSDAFYSANPCVYVFDGENAKASRREVYPDYKAGRPPAPDGFYHTLNFFRELLTHTKAIVIRVHGYEADDVISYMARQTKKKMTIHSTDADYLALCSDLVSAPLSQAGKLAHIPAQEIRLYKALVGDSSDNVKGWKLFGKKAWDQMSEAGKAHMIGWLSDEATELESFHLLSDLCRQSHVNWLLENSALMRSYWKVVGFMDMDPALIGANMLVGTPDYKLADSKLKDIFV